MQKEEKTKSKKRDSISESLYLSVDVVAKTTSNLTNLCLSTTFRVVKDRNYKKDASNQTFTLLETTSSNDLDFLPDSLKPCSKLLACCSSYLCTWQWP